MAESVSLWPRDKIDLIGAVTGLLTGLLISFLNLIYTNAYMISVGPTVTAACLLYLLFRRKLLLTRKCTEASRTVFLTTGIIFWTTFTVSICCLHIETLHRPPVYFLLTAAAASMVAAQIIYSDRKSTTYLILFEILLLSLSVSASAYWVFPSIPGIDTWGHREYIRSFVEYGGITRDPVGYQYYYLNFPIMHLNAVALKLMGAVDYKAAMFLGVSLPLVLSSLFVFLIGRSLASDRVGLLAMLLYSLSSYFVAFGIQPVATSFGLALFLITTYLLIKCATRFRIFISLTICLLLVLIVTHTMSAFVMFIFLIFLLIGTYIYRFIFRERVAMEANIVTAVMAGLFGTVMLSYWTYVAHLGDSSFFSIAVTELYSETATEAAFGHYELPVMREPGQIVNIVGFLILLFFGILGCLLWLSREHSGKTKTGLSATLIGLLCMPLGLAAFGIEAIVPDRWFGFSCAVLAVVAAFAMPAIASRFRYQWLGNMLLVFIVFIGVFFMTSNKIANVDSPVYTRELTRRLVYTNAELALGEKVIEIYDGTIVTDLDYGMSVINNYLQRFGHLSYGIYEEEQINSGIVLWRDVMVERPVRVPPDNKVLGANFEHGLESSHHLVYTNSDSKAYLSRSIVESEGGSLFTM